VKFLLSRNYSEETRKNKVGVLMVG